MKRVFESRVGNRSLVIADLTQSADVDFPEEMETAIYTRDLSDAQEEAAVAGVRDAFANARNFVRLNRKLNSGG